MSKLYLVPTPIGNLKDISLRALEILNEVDTVLVEDTRVSKKLFAHHNIKTRHESYHAHNEHYKLDSISERVQHGETMALITDAGTPGISDPGFLLVRKLLTCKVTVECLPGAVAFIPALVISGLPCERFVFEGFLPTKKGRLKRLDSLINEKRTMVFYESPHRLIKTLTQMAEYFGKERATSVSRELSKRFEETIRGSLMEVLAYFKSQKPKGEFVIVLAGYNSKHD